MAYPERLIAVARNFVAVENSMSQIEWMMSVIELVPMKMAVFRIDYKFEHLNYSVD